MTTDGDGARSNEAARPETPAARPRRRWSLVALAAAALVACWNPVAAPFGLVVGFVTAVLAVLALRRARDARRLATAALAMSVVAVIASVVVLALTTGGVEVDLGGEPVVKGRSPAELDQVLSEAAGRTKERRDRAVQELDAQRGRSGAAGPGTGAAPGRAPPPAPQRKAP